MRIVINLLIGIMLLGILGGVMVHHTTTKQHQSELEMVRDEVRRFQREVLLQSTLRKVEINSFGYPVTIDPAWFEDNPPRNTLLGPRHPWVEIAHEQHDELTHPVEKIAGDRSAARFWYNPATGRVRARVPVSASDATALRMYNFINDTSLTTLFADDIAATPVTGQ